MHDLATLYGWGPWVWGRLTPAQTVLYLGKRRGSKKTLGPLGLAAFNAKRQARNG